MISPLLRRIQSNINVYSGISPSLLATMSLSVNIRGNNHIELIQNMVKAGLIQNQHEIKAFKQLDRQLFTTSKNPYENKPYPISNRENMTDIFTHSVIINNLSTYWNHRLRVLDIGTGHGYLSFLIAQILENKAIHEFEVTGLDIHKESINFSSKLKEELRPQDKRMKFQCSDLGVYLETVKDNSLDVIIGGYFFEQAVTEKLMTKLTPRGVGIWPTRSDAGQALYKIEKGKQQVYLIETLFSMPVVRSEVSKYFVEEGENPQEEVESPAVEQTMDLEQVKKIKKQMQQKLRKQLKALIEKHRKSDNKLPNLKQMKQIPEINAKLLQLQKLPRLKVKCQMK